MARIVLFVDGSLLPSREGATCRFLETARLLSRRHDVIVLHCWRGWSDLPQLAKEPYRTVLVHPHDYYCLHQRATVLPALLKHLQPDWVQTKDPEVLAALFMHHMLPERTRILFECHDVHAPGSLSPHEEQIERWACHTADAIVCLTEADYDQLQTLGYTHMVAIPCTLPPIQFATPAHTGRGTRLAFLGNLYYGPNAEAVQWLCETFLPCLHRRWADVELHLFGDAPSPLRARYQAPSLFWHGYSPDLMEMATCDVGCSLVLHGTGFRVKTLHYIAMGLPVLANTLGVAGIGAHPCFRVADHLETLAQECLALLSTPQLRQSLAVQAQNLLRSQFASDALLERYGFLDHSGGPCRQPISTFPSWVQNLATRQPGWLVEMVEQGRYPALEDALVPPGTWVEVSDQGRLTRLHCGR